MSDQRFPKELRIRSQADFDRVYAARAFAADDVLVVNGGASDCQHPRLGLSISRKVGNAVIRNAWKRRIREAFRLVREQLPAGVDLVVRPQQGARCELEAIAQSLPALAKRVARKLAGTRRGTPTE
jgi:ribonuclease P protein component